MKTKVVRVFACFAALMLIASTALAQDAVRYKELPNFHKVNNRLYRGGQPKAGGLKLLKELKIKTILNLRDDDGRAKREEAEALRLGLQYRNIPLGRWDRPDDKDIENALSVITAAENQPVFVHCAHGADRTGVVIAAYRMQYDHATSGEAKAEAKKYGLKPWQFGIKDYIHDYYRRLQERKKTPAGKAPEPLVAAALKSRG